MSVLITHTDDECEDAHCPIHVSHEFVAKNGTGPKGCRLCKFEAIRMIGDLCEPCYRTDQIDPVVAEWHAVLAQMDQVHTKLSERLSKLTQSSMSDNFNMNITCQCGKVYNSGIAMFKHLPECEGPKPKTVHRTVTTRAVKIDLKNFTIG